MDKFLLQVCVLVLLPMVPAGLLFRFFQGQGSGQGTLFGFKWSFGGAFAAYLIIFFSLWMVMGKYIVPGEAEVWTVRGRVLSGDTQDVSNRILIRTLPDSLNLINNGDYEYQVIVERKGDILKFPKLVIDMSRLCGDKKIIPLNGRSSTFETVPDVNAIAVKKIDNEHVIEVAPIGLSPSVKAGPCLQPL